MLEVGRIGRAHGVRGEVVVRLVTDRLERLDPGSVLSTDRGELVVASSRPHGDRWVVRFEGIGGRESAEELRGTVLRAEAIDDPDTLWVHELIGAPVLDAEGTDRGTVVSVQANPASDLLELSSGALVPLVFLVERRDDGVLIVDVPCGLFELYGG